MVKLVTGADNTEGIKTRRRKITGGNDGIVNNVRRISIYDYDTFVKYSYKNGIYIKRYLQGRPLSLIVIEEK